MNRSRFKQDVSWCVRTTNFLAPLENEMFGLIARFWPKTNFFEKLLSGSCSDGYKVHFSKIFEKTQLFQFWPKFARFLAKIEFSWKNRLRGLGRVGSHYVSPKFSKKTAIFKNLTKLPVLGQNQFFPENPPSGSWSGRSLVRVFKI